MGQVILVGECISPSLFGEGVRCECPSRYRALEDERRKWETRESRLYARLEAVEEELRTTKTTACDAGDNEHLREQLRTLTSDLNGVQSLVESLATENSRLKEENERLDQENLSFRDQLTGLLRSEMGRDGRSKWKSCSTDDCR